jgi:hypothetical protein
MPAAKRGRGSNRRPSGSPRVKPAARWRRGLRLGRRCGLLRQRVLLERRVPVGLDELEAALLFVGQLLTIRV